MVRKKTFKPTLKNMTAFYKKRGLKNPAKLAKFYMMGLKNRNRQGLNNGLV